MRLYGQMQSLCHHFGIANNIYETQTWDFFADIPPSTSYDNGYKKNYLPIVSTEALILNECGDVIEVMTLPTTEIMYHYGDGIVGNVLLFLKGFGIRNTPTIIGKFCFAYRVCYDSGECYTYYSDWFKDYQCSSDVVNIAPCLDLTSTITRDVNNEFYGTVDLNDFTNIPNRNYLHRAIFHNLVHIPRIYLRNGMWYAEDYQYEFTIKANRSLKTNRKKIITISGEEIGDYYVKDVDAVAMFGRIVVQNKETNEIYIANIEQISMPLVEKKVLSRFHSLKIDTYQTDIHRRGCINTCYYES